MNIRFLFLFLVLGILALVILFSAFQIAVHYVKVGKDNEMTESIEFGGSDSKEQIISDLTAENERLSAELKKLRGNDSLIEDEE